MSIDRVHPAPDIAQASISFVEADITHYADLEQAFHRCNAVIHLAAIPAPGTHPDHVVHNNNVVGSYNALRAAAELGINRVCQASSVNATGLAYSRWPRFDYFPRYRTYGQTGWQVRDIIGGMWRPGEWTGVDDDELLRPLHRATERGNECCRQRCGQA